MPQRAKQDELKKYEDYVTQQNKARLDQIMAQNRENAMKAKNDYSKFLSKQINVKQNEKWLISQEKQRLGQQMVFKQQILKDK